MNLVEMGYNESQINSCLKNQIESIEFERKNNKFKNKTEKN